MTYTNLEEIASAYVQAAQAESEALFQQGDVLIEAIEDGWRVKDVVRHCASLTRRTTRTVFSRYHVSKVFTPELRDDALDWSIHALCADTPKPYDWLALAADGYDDENGVHHDHSYRTLKAAIKAAGGEPDANKPVYLLDNVEAMIYRVTQLPLTGTLEVTLAFMPEMANKIHALPCQQLVNVSLVLVQTPSVELEAS
jgi:hypothetical protein